MDSHCPDSDLQKAWHSCCDFQGMMSKATIEQAVQNLMKLDLVVKTSGHLTQTLHLSWSSSPVQKSHSTGDEVQPSENPDCTTGACVSFHTLETPTQGSYTLIFFLSVSMCEYKKYCSRKASQALYFDFWQKQSELAIPEVDNYGIKIKERLRCLLRFWIIVPVPSRFLFHGFHTVKCGKLRQIQLVTLFGRSRLEPDELCLLWNLIRFPVFPSWFQCTANNSVQMSFHAFCLQSTPSFAPTTSPLTSAWGPVREIIAHIKYRYVSSLLCYPLSWPRCQQK